MTKQELRNLFGALPTQGAKAVRSGRTGEEQFEGIFRAHKIKIVNDDRGYHNGGQLWPHQHPFLVRQFLLDGLSYDYRVDYMYMGFPGTLKLPIEIKSQMGGGTTDEKLVNTAEQLMDAGLPYFWIVIFGEQFRGHVIKRVMEKLKNKNSGRIIYGDDSMLRRAIERLVDKGNPKPENEK